MTRELTKEQADFLLRINSPEWREAARKQQEAEEKLREQRRIEYEQHYAAQQAKREEMDRRQREAMQPLVDILTKAGVKLELHSYDGVWGSYQIGDGPLVALDLDYLEIG